MTIILDIDDQHHQVVRVTRRAPGGVSPAGRALTRPPDVETAMRWVVEAQTTDVLFVILDYADDLERQVRRHRLGRDAQNCCAILSLTAARRIGLIMEEIERAPVGRPKNNGIQESHLLTLREMKIDKNLANLARRLAAIPQWEFDGLLRHAFDKRWEISKKWLLNQHDSRIRQEQNRQPQVGGHIEDLHEVVESGLKFGTLYLDPPWPVEDLPYATMSADDLAALPISDLAASRCHLHMWTLEGRRMRALAYHLIEGWGFSTVSELAWGKSAGRLRRYGKEKFFRMSHEIMLTGSRTPWTDQFDDHGLPSWIEAPAGAHSEKPDEVRKRIERASPPPRLELFARREVEGWYTWGHQIPTPLTKQRP